MDRLPFLSYLLLEDDPKTPDEEDRRIVGVIQNVTTKFVMMYDMTKLSTVSERKVFMNLVQEWWDESNTNIPVNIFIGRDFDPFYYSLSGIPIAGIREIHGHQVNIQKTFGRKIKRRRIEFIKTPQSIRRKRA